MNRFASLDAISRRVIPTQYVAPRVLATQTVSETSATSSWFEATEVPLLDLFPDYVVPDPEIT